MITDKILAVNNEFEINSPDYLAQTISSHFKVKRIGNNISQHELARRSGVSLGSIKRFETLHEISLKNLLKLAVILNASQGFEELFIQKDYSTIDDIKKEKQISKRKRAGRKHGGKH